jgi:hypothetical protein
MIWTWSDVTARLAAEPEGTRLRLPRPQVQHPLDGGLRRGVDLPVGQRADFRMACGERTLCVQDFGSHYEAFFGATGASSVGAAYNGEPGAATGALCALVLAGTREAVLVGALLGAALGRRRG